MESGFPVQVIKGRNDGGRSVTSAIIPVFTVISQGPGDSTVFMNPPEGLSLVIFRAASSQPSGLINN